MDSSAARGATAQDLARKQREISVAEFFEKNRQILGFDSPQRSLATCVKEAVDNSLDACEEAGLLPDIYVEIRRAPGDAANLFRVIVEDNGPGIVAEQVPRVFGKLLYGSHFHVIRQSRGQQGIGISACVLYAQLTTGRPALVLTKTAPDRPASRVELTLDTRRNEARVLRREEASWDRPRGTRVELEVRGAYFTGRRSVPEYLRACAIVNPHARITFLDPEGMEARFDRSSDHLPRLPGESKPHPGGTEMGTLLKMVEHYAGALGEFLQGEFARVGPKTAREIADAAQMDPQMRVGDLTRGQAQRLVESFRRVKLLPPSADSLSPIGEDLMFRGLQKGVTADFISVVTRPPGSHGGHPFIVEVALAYGGAAPREEKVEVLRFANRVPLLYQPGACALTHAVERVHWRPYGLDQSGESLPQGPALLLVHLASTHVPFVSESKDAVADIPEVLAELDLALKQVGRDLKGFLSKRKGIEKRREKEDLIQRILPKLAEKVGGVLQRPPPDTAPVVARIMGNLLLQRDGARLHAANHGEAPRRFHLAARSHQVRKEWDLSLEPGARRTLDFPADHVHVEGLPAEMVTLGRGLAPLDDGKSPRGPVTRVHNPGRREAPAGPTSSSLAPLPRTGATGKRETSPTTLAAFSAEPEKPEEATRP